MTAGPVEMLRIRPTTVNADFPRTQRYRRSHRAPNTSSPQCPPELLTYDNNNGDWRNYTRTIPAGTYNVYSRQSTFALRVSLTTLERRNGRYSRLAIRSTSSLGAFLQFGDDVGDTGYDNHRNVPLTDASGNPAVVRFAGGVTTLRVTDRSVNDEEDSEVFHNYLVLVPTHRIRDLATNRHPDGTNPRAP